MTKREKIMLVMLIISGFLMFNMSNVMLGQSAKIQMLKQSNVEQQEEKEFYINKYKELEKRCE